MSRGFRADDPDIEIPGRLDGSTPAAWVFFPDFGPEDKLFIPKSQSTWVPDPDSTSGGGTMFVSGWLARKNDWVGTIV